MALRHRDRRVGLLQERDQVEDSIAVEVRELRLRAGALTAQLFAREAERAVAVAEPCDARQVGAWIVEIDEVLFAVAVQVADRDLIEIAVRIPPRVRTGG